MESCDPFIFVPYSRSKRFAPSTCWERPDQPGIFALKYRDSCFERLSGPEMDSTWVARALVSEFARRAVKVRFVALDAARVASHDSPLLDALRQLLSAERVLL